MRQFLKKPLSWAKAPDNVRRNLGTEEERIALGNSYKKRPIHPLIAKQDGTMIDGWRRVNGLRRIGETEAEFLVTDENLTPEEIVQIGLVTAMHRQALSDAELYLGCKKLMQMHPQWLRKDLAAAAKLNGMTRDALAAHVRKHCNGHGDKPAVRVARIRCPMPSGVCVTVAGEGGGLSLDDLIDTLVELLKEAREANDQGLDSKTFSAVLKDKAKAGG